MHFGTDTVYKRCTNPTKWSNGQFAVRDIMMLYKSPVASNDCGKEGAVGQRNGHVMHRWLRIGLTASFQPTSRSGQVYQSMVVHKSSLYFIDGVKSMLNRANLDDCKSPSTDCLNAWEKFKLRKPGHIVSLSSGLYLFGPQLQEVTFSSILGMQLTERILLKNGSELVLHL